MQSGLFYAPASHIFIHVTGRGRFAFVRSILEDEVIAVTVYYDRVFAIHFLREYVF